MSYIANLPTSSETLFQISKKILGSKAIYPVSTDQIPPLKKDRYYIINMDDSYNQGTHWTLLSTMNEIPFYFSSYGDPPSEEAIQACIRFGGNTLRYNGNQIQSLESNFCGYFCLAFMVVGEKLCELPRNNEKVRFNNNEVISIILQKYID